MINFNTVNKANTAQSLLPSFSETADISDKSFQSIFDSIKDNSYDNSISPYSRKENSYSSYQENNSYSSYSDTKKYSDRVSENKYSKDDNDYNRNDDNRYNKDKENYEAVERKVYRDDSPASRNMKNTNTIKEQNVFEKRDVKAMQNSQAETGSNKNIAANQEIQSNQNTHTQPENSQAETISIKDILALLQTAAKNNTVTEAANDEDAALENINIDVDALIENIDTAISELNISDDLKMQLQNIISTFENMDKSDLGQLVEYISALSEDINMENISLEEISEKILGTEIDSSSLEEAYNAIQEKISELTNQPKDRAETVESIENSEIITSLKSDSLNNKDSAEPVESIENSEIITSLKSDSLNNAEIINNLSALIDEAVKEADLSSNNEKLELAKNIISTVKTAAENILAQADILSENKVENTVTAEEALVMNTEISDEAVMQTALVLEDNAENKQPVLSADVLTESGDDIVKSNNNSMQKLADLADAAVEENINSKQSDEKLSQETAKETLKDTVKESVKDIVKDTVKQADTVSVKDVQKEFKTANVEVTESLRGDSNAKAEIKANTVNLSETGKNLQNNLNQKEMMMTQNIHEENFSASQSDKGNNFNYFLKSSAEAQAKYDTAQSKEAQAPYNMKEPRDIERLVRTMQSSVSKGESKLTVTLTPENLGKMEIQLSESGGKITAKFLSDNESSHKLIMAQSDLLKNQLSEKGIVVDNMEFAYNDAMNKQQNNDEQGRRTSKQTQKGKSFRSQEDDLEVGTEVANKKSSGIYA